MISFKLYCLFKDTVSKYSHILLYWVVRTSTCKIGGERVKGKKTRGLKMEGIGCKHHFLSLSQAVGGNKVLVLYYFPLLYTNLYWQKKKCNKAK